LDVPKLGEVIVPFVPLVWPPQAVKAKEAGVKNLVFLTVVKNAVTTDETIFILFMN